MKMPFTTSLLKTVSLGSRSGRRALDRLTARSGEVLDRKLLRRAESIVRAVRRKGDAALTGFVHRFDAGGEAGRESVALRLPVPDPEAEAPLLPPGFADALERAIAAVDAFHRRQVHPGYRMETDGVELEERRQPFRRVGVYVPGGLASYPSTVVMTVVPARVAGVGEIAVATPPGSFAGNAALRYTLGRLGVDEVWGMGGAHGVAALAYGTETVPRVDKIVGPGNAWVTAAKKLVAGDVAIDGLAGPTEVLIVADGDADPALVAADLLAQAEHDRRAAAVLVTDERKLARAVEAELEAQVEALATAEVARASLAAFGTAFVVDDMAEALEVIEAMAPEHLQLVGEKAEALADRVRSAGAVFLGAATPEVFGDYVAGPSHVLPTGGSARFASALGVEDFVRRSHVVRFSPEAAERHAAAAATLADAEGLPGHAAAARRRLG
jgi:histidinol dehydrogenase